MPESFRPCPVCERSQTEPLHRQRFVLPEHHPLAQGYDVVHCLGCGFVYADVRATQADYDNFYAELSKYGDSASSTGSGDSPLDQERLDGAAKIISGYLPSMDARTLDIGCAGGGFLSAMQRRGYRNLVGIDPSHACVRMTREKIGEARQGWLGNLPSELGTSDCVTLSHVLEHVFDVPPAIASLRTLLREGGLVYIEVPDAEQYANHIYAPFQEFNTEHINHFSRRCLDNAMGRQGFALTAGGKRILRPSAYTSMPALYGIYRWTGVHSCRTDTELKSAVLTYIERSSALMTNIDSFIGEAMADSPELIVWGAGQLTLKLLAETCLAQAKLIAFVDSNPIHQGHRIAGAPVLAPEAVRSYSQPILIATLLHQKEIANQIASLALTNRIILLPERKPESYTAAV